MAPGPAMTAMAGELSPSDGGSPPPSRFEWISSRLQAWRVVVRGDAMLAPDYEGSDKLELSPIPWVSGTFHDVVTIDPSGALVHLYERGPFRFGARLGYEPGRKEKNSRHLGGLGTIDAAPTLGAKAAFTYGGAGHLFAERGSVEIVGLGAGPEQDARTPSGHARQSRAHAAQRQP